MSDAATDLVNDLDNSMGRLLALLDVVDLIVLMGIDNLDNETMAQLTDVTRETARRVGTLTQELGSLAVEARR